MKIAMTSVLVDDQEKALRFYTDLGFDHLVVHGPGHDQERFLSTFCEQVLPGLGSHAGREHSGASEGGDITFAIDEQA